MKHEFKLKKYKDATVYTLESATGGGTSAGAVGTGPAKRMGPVISRGGLVTSEEKKEAPKPRNFVAKNAKMGGAGQHKDKKKAAKQGDAKHKKPFAEDHEIQMATSELEGIAKNAVRLLSLVRKYSEQEGLDAWQQSKITKAADYLNAVLQAVSGEQTELEGYGSNRGYAHGFASPTAPSLGQRRRDHDSGDDEPEGMFTVVIDGRPWKEFTSNKAFQVAKTIATKHPDKQVQVKWPNGQLNTVKEDVEDRASYIELLTQQLAEKLDPNAPTDVWVKDFQKANPNKYHQFKNKTPAKKAQMAVAAHYAANEPSKKK